MSGKSNLVNRFLRKTAPRLLCLPPFPFCTFAGIFALSGKYLCTCSNRPRSVEFSSRRLVSPRRGLVPCARPTHPLSAPCGTVDNFLLSQTQPSARQNSASQNSVGKALTWGGEVGVIVRILWKTLTYLPFRPLVRSCRSNTGSHRASPWSLWSGRSHPRQVFCGSYQTDQWGLHTQCSRK